MRGYGLIYAELRRLAGSYLRYESQFPYGHYLHEERSYSTVVVLCGLLCLCLCEPRFSSSLANLADERLSHKDGSTYNNWVQLDLIINQVVLEMGSHIFRRRVRPLFAKV